MPDLQASRFDFGLRLGEHQTGRVAKRMAVLLQFVAGLLAGQSVLGRWNELAVRGDDQLGGREVGN